MNKRNTWLIVFALVANLIPSARAEAGFFDYLEIDRQEHLLTEFGVGFGVIEGVVPLATQLGGHYFFSHNLSIGVTNSFDFHGDFFLWGLQGVGRYTCDIPWDDFWERLKPTAEIRIGLGVITNGASDVGFLGGFGFGADYYLNSRLAVGSQVNFNFSDDLGGAHFLFQWPLARISYLF